jgi:hypothetical protein
MIILAMVLLAIISLLIQKRHVLKDKLLRYKGKTDEQAESRQSTRVYKNAAAEARASPV